MELEVKDGSPDGMYVTYKTYINSWEGLKKFIDYIAEIERKGL